MGTGYKPPQGKAKAFAGTHFLSHDSSEVPWAAGKSVRYDYHSLTSIIPEVTRDRLRFRRRQSRCAFGEAPKTTLSGQMCPGSHAPQRIGMCERFRRLSTYGRKTETQSKAGGSRQEFFGVFSKMMKLRYLFDMGRSPSPPRPRPTWASRGPSLDRAACSPEGHGLVLLLTLETEVPKLSRDRGIPRSKSKTWGNTLDNGELVRDN